jgi:hypothetical protein
MKIFSGSQPPRRAPLGLSFPRRASEMQLRIVE